MREFYRLGPDVACDLRGVDGIDCTAELFVVFEVSAGRSVFLGYVCGAHRDAYPQ